MNVLTDKDAREAAVKQIFNKEKSDEPAGRSVPTEIREFRESYKEFIKKRASRGLWSSSTTSTAAAFLSVPALCFCQLS